MSDFPTPWASIGQGLEMVAPCDPSAGDDCPGTAHRWPRLLADLQEHGYPQETKQEEVDRG